jgi:hypothetical protein
MTAERIRAPLVLLIVAALAASLVADAHGELAGQAAAGLCLWALLSWLLGRVSAQERRALMACVVIATAGEMFFSLGWGLYTYRLGNIPLYVPPGHALMLMLGTRLAHRMPEAAARAVIGGASIYSLAAAAAGLDTFGVLLCLVFAGVAFAMPAQRRLYASTFLLSLALELGGTWLGNWSWAREVPLLGLTTTNPPGAVGAFYCALDALVAGTSMLVAARFGRVHRPTELREAMR